MVTAANFTEFLDALPDAYAGIDNRLRYEFANHAFERLIGVSREQLTGSLVNDVTPTFGRTDLEESCRRVMDECRAVTFLTQSKGEKPLQVTLTPFADGILARFFAPVGRQGGVLEDIIPPTEPVVASTELLWSVDPVEFGLLSWNDRFEDYCRSSHGTAPAVGIRPEDLFPAHARELAEEWRGFYRKALSGTPFTCDYRPHLDARRFEFTFHAMRTAGEVAGISVMGKDVTGQRQALETIRESEQRFRCLSENSSIGAYAVTNGKWSYVNQALARGIGYPAEELLGRSPLEVIEPEDHAKVEDCIRRRMTGEVRSVQYEVRAHCRDGSVKDIEVHGSRIHTGGQPTMIGYVVDITARKLAEQALRESETLFRALYERAPLGIALVDAVSGLFLRANPAYCRITGLSEEQMRRTSFRSITHADDVAGDEENQRRLRDGEVKEFQAEKRYVRPGGSTVWVKLAMVPLAQPDGSNRIHLAIVEDITERRWNEEELKRSEERFSRVFLSSPIATTINDMGDGGRFLAVNDAFERTSGFRREEVVGRRPAELDMGVEPAHAEEVVRLYHRDGKVRNAAYNFRRKGGEPRIGTLSLEPLREDAGSEVIVAVADMTERIRAERALQSSETLYRLVVESISDVIWILDLETGFLRYVSPSVERLIGYTAEETIEKQPLTILTPAAAQAIEPLVPARLSELRAGVRPVSTFETELQHRNGSTVWIEASTHLVMNEENGHIEVYGVSRDITRRKQAQEELRLSQQKLREASERLLTVAKCIPDTLWSIDLDGRFTYISPAVERSHGWRLDEVASRNARDLLLPDEAVKMAGLVREELAKAAAADYDRMRIFTVECEQLRQDGTTFWAEVSATFIWSDQGQPIGISGVTRDITERKRNQAEREKLFAQVAQAQKMESVGRLAGGVAHDFNNLLTVINGYGKFALSGMKDADPLRGFLQEIVKAGDRAAGLTRQLLAFSRKQVMQPQVLNLNSAVSDMRSMLDRLLGEDVDLQLHLSEYPLTVRADQNQLEQVILNLAMNARDAMEDGGTLTIGTAVERETRGAAFAVLTVRDTGKGMDEASRHRMFEPFFTTKEIGKGTGLGLSMVQGIIDQSGGHIEVESESGRGTTFRVYLPALDTGAPDPIADDAVISSGDETILVVEDEDEIRNLAVTALRKHGYRVIQTSNADEALEICAQGDQHIDLVLTDVVMPCLTGRQLASRLVKLRPGIRILFSSGNSEQAGRELLQSDQFIQKPYCAGELAAKIRAALERRTQMARILVVDDEAGVRSFLRAVLEPSGYEVVEATDGKQALRLAIDRGPELVITDLVMPEQEGIETIRELRRQVPEIGIIAVSGAFSGMFLKVAEKLGADAVIAKPVSAELLLSKVSEVLQNRRQVA